MHANQHFTAQIIAKGCFFRSSCYLNMVTVSLFAKLWCGSRKASFTLVVFFFSVQDPCEKEDLAIHISSVFVFFWSRKNIFNHTFRKKYHATIKEIELSVLEWKVLYQRSQMRTIILSKVYSFVVAKQQLWYICNLWTKWKVYKHQ
jgi:hypothetical protein